jgi:hypothetical protein
MSRGVWLGGIYLKDEGGYDLVLRSLHHYKKRLRNIKNSPEIKDAPMFAQLVEQEAMKSYPLVGSLIKKVSDGLQNQETLRGLESEIELFKKALDCYQSDIQKMDSDPFYSGLIPDKNTARADLEKIKDAIAKISEFA